MDLETTAEYCRSVETYLCRKNDGHLIRIVGPSFERVCAWAAKGIPMRVVCAGIDRYFERYYSKGPRRRPVHIDFCEADVLDAFDEWRRALGLRARSASSAPGEQDVEETSRRRASLPAHLDRVIARLTTLRGGEDRGLASVLDDVVRELDLKRSGVRGLRGDARSGFLARLQELDVQLLTAARERLDGHARDQIQGEAESELEPFKGRLPADAYERSLAHAVQRLIRERARLPVLTFE